MADHAMKPGWTLLMTVTLLGSLGGSGCAPREAVYLAGRADAHTHQPSDDVELLLDRTPDRPFIVTGELTAQSIANDRSIKMMRARAASAGLDGIYWIDCTSPCSGRCTAKGFVYEDRVDAASADDSTVASAQ